MACGPQTVRCSKAAVAGSGRAALVAGQCPVLGPHGGSTHRLCAAMPPTRRVLAIAGRSSRPPCPRPQQGVFRQPGGPPTTRAAERRQPRRTDERQVHAALRSVLAWILLDKRAKTPVAPVGRSGLAPRGRRIFVSRRVAPGQTQSGATPMRTPMLLPWLASRARVSEARAEVLWRAAILRAEEVVGETDSSAYWGASLAALQELLELERWRPQAAVLWPWRMLRGGLESWSWWSRHWLWSGLLLSAWSSRRLAPLVTRR